MNSTFIKAHRRRRGTAEIETMLVIPVLLTILFIAGGLAKFGAERLSNVFAAETTSYSQSVQSQPGSATDVITPVEGPGAVRPGLPNWYTGTPETRTVAIPFGRSSTDKAIIDQVVFLDPSWRITEQEQSWFEADVMEDHSPQVSTALGLVPAWTP